MINAMNVINLRSPALPAQPDGNPFPCFSHLFGDIHQDVPGGSAEITVNIKPTTKDKV
jgi:hypothetical protein